MHGLITLTPIGVVRSPFVERAEAPRQPQAAEGVRARIELTKSADIGHALEDLEGWDYLWVIFVFHKNEGWRPKVLPPRSTVRRGVFATRAPYRPNPIGLSVVKLLGVEGTTVHVENVDILDGSPVLDIKPYVPYADAYPDARTGWLDDERTSSGAARPGDPKADWTVTWSPLAEEQLAFLGDEGDAVRATLATALALGPEPHPYRRIKRVGGAYRIGVKAWRAYFEVLGPVIRVTALESGYAKKERETNRDPALDVHRAFAGRFPRD
ncbi:MAG: tRNA (N6-threonylcarbamoyladenosine(37)-N6)-methyltransferase TrmO [Polyangiaceae bacterium]